MKHDWKKLKTVKDGMLYKCSACGDMHSGDNPPEYGCPGKIRKSVQKELF